MQMPLFSLREQRAKRICLHIHLATAAITSETRKACFVWLPGISRKLPVAGSAGKNFRTELKKVLKIGVSLLKNSLVLVK